MSDSLEAIFQAKYDEFAAALTDVFPELTGSDARNELLLDIGGL